MSRGRNDRGLRFAVAAVAAGLGYAYHALSQDRSIRSKLIEDKGRVEKELQKGRSSQTLGEQLQRRIEEAQNASIPNEIKARYNMFTTLYKEGTVEVIHGSERCENRPYLIYLHGGQRIDAMSNKEWHFVGQLAEELNATVLVPQMQLLPDNNFADESTRLLNLLKAIHASSPDKKLYMIAYDTGAMYALNVAAQAAALTGDETLIMEKVILISPWLDATLGDPEIIAASHNDFEQDLEMMQIIQRVWEQKEPLLNLAEMSVISLPPVAIISGTYDLHEPVTYHFYKRLRAKHPNTHYYRFDRMMHSFFLNAIPEAEEAIQLIGQIVFDKAPVKRAR